VFDGDPQARVKDRDRDRATYVIDAALRNGQITQQDRDLRVERVQAASTIGDLAGLTRDIAAAPVAAPVPPTAVVPPPVPVPAPVPGPALTTPVTVNPYDPGSTRPVAGVPSDLYGPPPTPKPKKVASGTGLTTKPGQAGRKMAVGCAFIVALFVILPIAAGVIIFAAQTDTPDFLETEPIPAGPPFELTGAGLREYVAAFEETFEDTRVVRTVFYDGYVVSWVPQGDGDIALWNYVDGAFDQLGDPMSGSAEPPSVDLADLRPAKVMALLRDGEESLGVEQPTTTYVIYDRDVIEGKPHLMIYLTNDAGESGYLVGDLDGNVLQRSASAT
jgi:Domain of unknown function (DUF1707)